MTRMALTDIAIDKIKTMILDGRLNPGDRLPREADLAEQLGISRGSLREAVRALSMVRILDVRQGDGTYVTGLTPEILLETIGFVIDFHQDASILDLFEVRRALEPMAAEKAALLMPEDEAAGLLELVEAVAPDATVDDVVAADLEFHSRIADAAGNRVLSALIDGVARRTHRARIWRGVTQRDAVERTRREHRAIAEAIAQRQPSIAHACALAHVAGIESWLRRSVARPAEEETCSGTDR
jgi:DNA-binding FadR family transcriptional regulator